MSDSQKQASNQRAAVTLSLVLPAYNEQSNIRDTVTGVLEVLPRYFETFEVIIVNDGSRDQTEQVAQSLVDEDRRVRLVSHTRNRGYGGALRSGFVASTGDYVMFMDSDRQFAIEDISRLVPFIDSHDIVAGFRMERNDRFYRRLFAETFNISIRIAFGVHMRDIDCAFKIFDGDMLRSIDLTTSGALINTEIMAKARRQGARIQQVGVRHFPRIAGQSTGGNPRVIAKAMRDTPRLWLHMRSYDPPPDRPSPEGRHRLPKRAMALAAGLAVALMGIAVRRRSK